MEQTTGSARASLIAVITAAAAAQGKSLRSIALGAVIPPTTFHYSVSPKGKRSFTIDELSAIARELGTTASDLIAQAEAGVAA